MTGAWILAIFVVVLSATILLILHHTVAGEFLHNMPTIRDAFVGSRNPD